MKHRISQFWIDWAAGRLTLSPLFAERDAIRPHDEAEVDDDIPMSRWLALSDADRNDTVFQYCSRRPPVRVVLDDWKRVAA